MVAVDKLMHQLCCTALIVVPLILSYQVARCVF
ncbi:hypothetical protein SAMN05444678_1057 [Sphingomonas sp. YR710]|nr:hypothetical protein SAMN05444678_1057 [Sphingomonas sp. YR710]